MKISIRTFAQLREAVGKRSLTFEPKNPHVLATIKELGNRYPDLYELLFEDDLFQSKYIVMVNKETKDHDNLDDITLQDGDELAILPPAGGG